MSLNIERTSQASGEISEELSSLELKYSVDRRANFLNLNRLQSEKIYNSKTKSELDLIYLKDSAIIQIKRKNKPLESYYGFDLKVAKRIKSAWGWSAEDELIAVASVFDNSLFVMGCDLTTWEIPFTALPCLNKIPESKRGDFKIDKDGSYLHWENADLHLDLEEIKAAADPEFKEQLLLSKLEYGKSFGKAIAIVRKVQRLNQNEIDGISDRHLRRIENEGIPPTLDVLKKLSKAHGLDLEDYLTVVNQARVNIKS